MHFFATSFSIDFNKTPVIVQPLSLPFFCRNLSIFQQKKNTSFPTFHLCVVIFWVFLLFHYIWDVFQKAHVSYSRWALALVTAAQPCDHQAQGRPIPSMLSMSLDRESCTHFNQHADKVNTNIIDVTQLCIISTSNF